MIPSSQENFRHVRHLQIKALKDVKNFFSGSYRSIFKGKGLEFEGLREYAQGDEIRTIDWNVSARSEKVFVKHFREERELTLILVVDVSASSLFSHTNRLKNEIIAEIGALLAFSAIQNQDKVGLLLFSDQIELYLRPKKRLRDVLRLIRELLYFQPKSHGTNLKKALAFLGKVEKKQAICVLISDFLSEDFYSEALLLSKKHELIALRVQDSYEKQRFPSGTFTLCDLETTEEIVVDTADPIIQELYLTKAKASDDSIRSACKKIGMDFMDISTDEAPVTALHRFFKQRSKKKV